MFKVKLLIAAFIFGLLMNSCHKKNYPSNIITPDSTVAAKPAIKRKPKVPVAKVITVDDNAAHKSVDGRLYYDVMGRRYWKNYKDGKYYLFNQSMYNDPAFKAPK